MCFGWFISSWVNLSFDEFIFANNLSGFLDDGYGGFDDDLDKPVASSVSTIFFVPFLFLFSFLVFIHIFFTMKYKKRKKKIILYPRQSLSRLEIELQLNLIIW